MAANDNYLGCGEDIGWKELLTAAIGVDATGHYTLRVIDSDAVAGSSPFPCGTPPDATNLDKVLAGLFAFDSNGDVALRISIP